MTSVKSDLSTQSLKTIAIETLRDVCLDKDAPAAAKGQSARTILELIGEIGRNSSGASNIDSKDLSSISIADLDKEIARLSSKKT